MQKGSVCMKAITIYQRLTRFVAAFVLAVSTLTAVLPFMAAPSASALANADYTSVATDGWEKDRTFPSGGMSAESFGGRDALRLGVAVPSDAPSSFYQYEGVGKAVANGSNTIRGDLYIDPTWPEEVRVGFWGVGYDASSAISSYPIIEYNTRADSPTGWRVWDSDPGQWRSIAVNSAVSGWNKIEMALDQTDNTMTNIYVNDVLVGQSVGGATKDIRRIILNNYNFVSSEIDTSAPYTYNVYWSNLEAGTQYVATIGSAHYATLAAALTAAQNGDVVNLAADVTVTAQVTITKSITLNGNGHTITGNFAKTSNSNNSVIGVHANGVTINDLTVVARASGPADSTGLHAIKANVVTGLTITNTSVFNGLIGILVNGSEVAVSNITSSGNQWHAFNVDKGGELTISGQNTWSEASFIYIDNIDLGIVNDVDDQYRKLIIPNYNNAEITAVLYTAKDASYEVTIPVTDGVTDPLPVDTTISSPDAEVVIPEGTVITDPEGEWDGSFTAPIVSSMDGVLIPTGQGQVATVALVIEVGAPGVHLELSNAARLVLPGQAGKLAGYIRDGEFHPIVNVCSADTQVAGDALPAGGDCYMTVGDDLVIWTKHFTKFVAYSVKQTSTTPVTDNTDSDEETTGGSVAVVNNNTTNDETTTSDDDASVTPDDTNATDGESDVEAASTDNAGMAWYWWALIFVALVAIGLGLRRYWLNRTPQE